jgi:predicted dehydrogenase
LPEYRIQAVSTTSDETAREAAEAFGVPSYYSDAGKMMENPDVDVVSVVVRCPAHYEYVKMALNADKHVYCEWPLANTFDRVQELAALSRSKPNLKTVVGLQGRGSPAINYMRDIVQSGELGTIVSCNLIGTITDAGQRPEFNLWAYEHGNGAGTIHIPTGHCLDLLMYVLGDFASLAATTSVQISEGTLASTGQKWTCDTPDQVVIAGHLKSGAAASVHIQTVPVGNKNMRFEVHGTKGLLIASGDWLWMKEIELHGLFKDMRPAEEIYSNKYGFHGKENVSVSDELKKLDIPDKYTWVPADMPGGLNLPIGQVYRKLAEAIRGESYDIADFSLAEKRAKVQRAIEISQETGMRQMID